MVGLERFSAALIAAFAVWTIYVHALTFTECSFETLRKFSWLALLGAVAAALALTLLGQREKPIEVEVLSGHPWSKRVALHGIVAALVLIVVYRWTASYSVFWFLAVAYLLARRLSYGAGPVHVSEPQVEHKLDPSLLIIAGCVAVYVITRTQPNLDDTFQVNLIVGLLEHPSWPILRFDTMHRVENLPIMSSAYLSLSLEPLQAILADNFAVEPFALRHLVFSPVAAVVGIVYLYLFLRSLAPSWSGPALCSFVLVVLIYATEFRQLGTFYWEYLALGKSILIAMIVPALLWYTSRWMALGNTRDVVMIAAASVAAAGLTPNGIFVAPLTVGLLIIAHVTPDPLVLRRMVLPALCAAYPVSIGLLIMLTTTVTPSEVLGVMGTEDDFRQVLGWDWRFWAGATLLLSAWSMLPAPSSRRLVLSWTLLLFVILANPVLSPFWAHYLTGNLNWRLFWAFPVLLLIAITLQGSIRLLNERGRLQWMVPAVLLIGSVATGFSTLAPAKWHSLGLVADRTPMPEYQIAKVLRDSLRPADGVLAPNNISAYLATLQRHPRPVITRPLYLIHLKRHLPLADLEERALLYALVAPDQVANGEFQNLVLHIKQLGGFVDLDQREVILGNLGKILGARAIRTVAYERNSEFASRLDRLLSKEGFRNTPQSTYQVWIK